MTETTKTITLTNPTNNDTISAVLKCIGTEVIKTTDQPYDDDPEDIDVEYQFPQSTADLGVIGDDAIGAVVGAYMTIDDELMLIANYGDEGDYHYNVGNLTPNDIVKLSPLIDE